ncbi:RNA 2',3'-cyclic phosphodiesterase [Neobacillus kokaensis]|uniref:RNA 2',3'-cyclic phosphodiesterase n=2 Tax=Neobacillus kokaensis TaxID=2759023 RepID=A0ABQ3MXD1_9BACI|nr:RNA 2',3'-cyclic phosphodiesterase [Neobacillus kokaensis]
MQAHYFFAVRIPDETKIIMKDRIDKMKEIFPFSRWVHHLDFHITLAFLGSAESDKLSAAQNFVREAVKDENSFSLQIQGLGIFGREDSPRVFWADTAESHKLQLIRNKVFSACELAGFQLETRPFRPHITLARKWNSMDHFERKRMDEIQQEPLLFQVKDVVLYRTHLNQTPKYEAAAVFPLQT